MDLVIPYRRETQFNGIELHYCIKSFKKFFDIRNIYIIGHREPGTINIPFAEGPHKQTNIIQKIKKACSTKEISDPFICTSDDVFMLQSTEIKYWHQGEISGEAMPQYRLYHKNSKEKGCVYNYDNHAPIIYYKQKFLERVEEGNYLIQSQYAILEEGEYLAPLKYNLLKKEETILKEIEGQIRFSTGPSGVHSMKNVWKKLYD